MTPTTEGSAVWGVYATGRPMFNFNIASLIVLWFMFGLRGYVRVSMVKVWSATDWHMMVTMIYTVYAIIVVNSLYRTGYLCIILFQCHLVDYFWNQFAGATGGRCLSSTVIMNLSYAHNSMEIISDWIVSALPIWLLAQRQLTRRTKLAVGLPLSLGALHVPAPVLPPAPSSNAANRQTATTTAPPSPPSSASPNSPASPPPQTAPSPPSPSSSGPSSRAPPASSPPTPPPCASYPPASSSRAWALSSAHSGAAPSSKTPRSRNRNRNRNRRRASFTAHGAATSSRTKHAYLRQRPDQGHDSSRREDREERVGRGGDRGGGSFKSTESMVVVVEGRRPGDTARLTGQQYHAAVVSKQGMMGTLVVMPGWR